MWPAMALVSSSGGKALDGLSGFGDNDGRDPGRIHFDVGLADALVHRHQADGFARGTILRHIDVVQPFDGGRHADVQLDDDALGLQGEGRRIAHGHGGHDGAAFGDGGGFDDGHVDGPIWPARSCSAVSERCWSMKAISPWLILRRSVVSTWNGMRRASALACASILSVSWPNEAPVISVIDSGSRSARPAPRAPTCSRPRG